MRNKYIYIFILCFIMPIFIVSCTNSNSELKNGIYVLTSSNVITCLSSDNFKKISDININGGTNMVEVKNKKVYVTIRGTLSEGENKIGVLKNGSKKKVIDLKYSLPRIIDYNKFDNRVYVGHTYSLSAEDKNYITVINTKNDKIMKNF